MAHGHAPSVQQLKCDSTMMDNPATVMHVVQREVNPKVTEASVFNLATDIHHRWNKNHQKTM